MLDQPDDLVDHGVLKVIHDLADLGVGVPGQIARFHDRIVQSEHGRGIADHALGEIRGRLPCFPWREVVGELVEFGHGLGEDHRKYRVFGVEVEVEAGPSDPGTLADGADREIGERTFLKQLADGSDDRVALPVAPAAALRRR